MKYNKNQGLIGEYACVLKANLINVSSTFFPRRANNILYPGHNYTSFKLQFKHNIMNKKSHKKKRENESPRAIGI